MEESLDSSSAKCVYELVRDGRWVELRVTCGSEVRSHDPPSSSTEEREAKEADVLVGGNIRSLILLCKHRGIGIES